MRRRRRRRDRQHGLGARLGRHRRAPSAYVTTKHGLIGLTKNAALEYGAQGVRVNAVGPGFIQTPLLDANLDAEAQAGTRRQARHGRLGTPEEVAALVAFLAATPRRFVTGSYHLVDGGYAAH